MTTPSAALLPVTQAAAFTDADFMVNESISQDGFQDADPASSDLSDSDEKVRHRAEGKKFRYLPIILAALIFIVIIAWFETSRKWIEYYYLPSELTYGLAMSFTVHSTIVTVFSIVIVYIFRGQV